MSRLARFTVATVVVTFLLVAVGGLVRASDSGLGCGDDWPNCYGHWVPPTSDFVTTLAPGDVPDFIAAAIAGGGDSAGLSAHVRDSARSVEVLAVEPDGSVMVRVSAFETWIEYTHRLLGTLAGLMTIAVLGGAIRRRDGDPETWRLGRWLLPLVVAQGLLGAYVVGQDLQAWTVVAHLGMAMAYAGVLLALVVHLLRPSARGSVDRRLVRLTGGAAASVFGLNLLGSYVTGRDAGLAFTDWPLMNGAVVPDTVGHLVPALHFTHRLVAVLVGLFLIYVVREASRRGIRRVRAAAHVAAGLFGVQIAVGGLNVFTELHAAAVTVHLAVSVAIWGALVVAWQLASRSAAATVEGTGPVPIVPRASSKPSKPSTVPSGGSGAGGNPGGHAEQAANRGSVTA